MSTFGLVTSQRPLWARVIDWIALLIVFSFPFAAMVAVSHLLIDTRLPLQWWRKFAGQTTDPNNPAFVPFAMLQDQCAHILILMLAAGLST